jgi:hypothetical protein
LRPLELEQLLDSICPELAQEKFPAYLSALDGGRVDGDVELIP